MSWTLGASDHYVDPVWRIDVALTTLERELLAHPYLRRLAHIAHAGASSLFSPQKYSRLEHSLGLLALVSHLRPRDSVMRAAALLHDVGHLPLSHTLERTLGVNHHAFGDAAVRDLAPLLSRHGIDTEEVIDAVNGRGSAALGAHPGVMTLDHFESYVRSAVVHGVARRSARRTLEAVTLLDGNVACDARTAEYLLELVSSEADRQSHPDNVRATAVTGNLVRRVQESVDAKEAGEVARMMDVEIWAWLGSIPEISDAVQALLLRPERWIVRPFRDGPAPAGSFLYEIPRFYVDPPLVDGRPAGSRDLEAELIRTFTIVDTNA
jgi:HD superfamily phosphohydrolase